jgi:site-specific DNA-methyltransferase (adenine-specific)
MASISSGVGRALKGSIKAGFYETGFHGRVPKIQIFTIEELFAGKKPQIPFIDTTAFRKARQEETHHQERLF